ncbi:MAG: dienelactone hydrolase family protein [Acidobacteria bacterium]|nr:dienelactone hydrolase family protein [Acidobacteriota bacterium]
MSRCVLTVLCIALPLAATTAGQATRSAALDAAFAAFWDADDVRGAERAGQRIVEAGADFDDVLARLRAGRTYKKEATGTREMAATVEGIRLDNVVEIPPEYDPAKTWPLRVQLHGGVGRPAPRNGEPGGRPLTSSRIPGEPQIYLHPRAWNGVEWWRAPQVDNILKLVDAVKRKYNVDESRIYVTGISDGGTGVFFLAMREATAWSACLALNGHPVVLANDQVGADQQLYPTNLANCPMYLVNGGRDPLYPAASVAPFVRMMERAGASVEFHVHPEAGHDTSWWPVERPLYEKYLAAHPRTAHPASVAWETDRTDRYNRVRWLVIDRLGARDSDVELVDVNSVELPAGYRGPVYERRRGSGRVDVVRTGNTFDARTRGVQQFTLLLSPDVVDFSRPVRVTVNGRGVFEGVVTKDVAALVRWAARDHDRTMLYGAELTVAVP